MPRYPWVLECGVKWAVFVLMAYWLVYALAVPVTGWDSQTHNVARLLIANEGGLFGNEGWNMEPQAFFPWGFDAVHYPFLFLGFGYALPSFACLAGVMVIVFRIARENYGETAGWWCCLALLALPTLVYQATSNKNDIPILFGIACWFYALRLWRSEKRGIHLLFMAMALGFTAGAKSTGIGPAVLLSAWTFRQIGAERRPFLQFGLCLAAAFLLLGSTETYIYNIKVYHHLLGPGDMVAKHSNRDGLRGAAASAIRYFFGFLNLGFDSPPPNFFCDWLADACRATLRFAHLRDAGYYSNLTDQKLHFMQDGVEASSSYGPVGMLALFYALWVFAAHSRKDPFWKMSAAGIFFIGLLCWTIGWQPWCNRFLLVPAVLFTLVFILRIVGNRGSALYPRAAFPLFLLLLFSAVAFPWYSFNRSPGNIRFSIAHRDEMVAKENPGMLEIMKDIEALPGRSGQSLLLLHAGRSSWVLPILQIPLKEKRLQIMNTPELTEKALAAAKQKAAGRPIYILALNRQLDPDAGRNLSLVKKYTMENCSLLRWTGPQIQPP